MNIVQFGFYYCRTVIYLKESDEYFEVVDVCEEEEEVRGVGEKSGRRALSYSWLKDKFSPVFPESGYLVYDGVTYYATTSPSRGLRYKSVSRNNINLQMITLLSEYEYTDWEEFKELSPTRIVDHIGIAVRSNLLEVVYSLCREITTPNLLVDLSKKYLLGGSTGVAISNDFFLRGTNIYYQGVPLKGCHISFNMYTPTCVYLTDQIHKSVVKRLEEVLDGRLPVTIPDRFIGFTSDTPELKYGLELELENVDTSSMSRFPRGIRVVNDQSVGNRGKEFVFNTGKDLSESLRLIKYLTDKISIGKIEGEVTSRCGLHIHTSLPSYNRDIIDRYVCLYSLIEPFIFELLTSRGDNNFCIPYYKSPGFKRLVRSVMDEPEMSVSNEFKYYALNWGRFSDLHTVEWRMFDASKDYQCIRERFVMIDKFNREVLYGDADYTDSAYDLFSSITDHMVVRDVSEDGIRELSYKGSRTYKLYTE